MKIYKKIMNALAAVEKIVLVISTLLILVLTVGNRHGVSGPCHRCRGAHRSGTAAVRPGGPCAYCGHFCDRMLQHLRGLIAAWVSISSASAPHPLPCPCRFFAVASMLVSNLGLAAIIRLSTPVLNAIYPAAIVLILLSFMPGLEKHRAVYPLCMGLTALQSIAAALPLGAVSAAANALPLGSMGFGWVLPRWPGLQAGCF